MNKSDWIMLRRRNQGVRAVLRVEKLEISSGIGL
jgi:hypothetical protein